MIINEIEDQLIKDLFTFGQQQVLTPANLGILKSGSKEELIKNLENIDLNPLVYLKERDDYDLWFDEVVAKFHRDLLPFYRDNLVIIADNPYTYSARILNQYLKILYTKTWLYNHDGETYIKILHPILTNTFLSTFPQLEKRKVNQIKTRDDYYQIVEFYRELIDQDLSNKNKKLIELKFGEEV